ncbi:flagellar biosynthesis anti-sigma factor FlgM [Enterovibrio makurazakiensis]|uniref:flagellar biosynthesis anti-sigma factor FlgM n=1 Tax=Enterovibrio makurazakiensis TaxID=2910232 RepID=UPI003D196831
MIGNIGFTQSTSYVRETNTVGAEKTPAKQASNVELSADMRTLNAAKESIKHASDVDMDKVAAMKAMLKSGNLDVNLDNLADSIVEYYSPSK